MAGRLAWVVISACLIVASIEAVDSGSQEPSQLEEYIEEHQDLGEGLLDGEMPTEGPWPRTSTRTEVKNVGNKRIEKTITKTYHEDGRIMTRTRTRTITRTIKRHTRIIPVQDPCATEVKMAKNKCALRKAQLKEITGSRCGSTQLTSIMKELSTNHAMTNEQQMKLRDAMRALQMLESESAKTVENERNAEHRLAEIIANLKSQQQTLRSEEKSSAATQSDEKSLFERAQAATDDAVKHARASDDTETATGLRDQAADLFEHYVHQRVRMATLQRKASVSQDGVTQLSDKVKKKQQDAEDAVDAEKAMDAKIADATNKVDEMKVALAKQEAATAKLEVKASEEEKTMLKGKMSDAHAKIEAASKAMDQSEAKERKADQEVSKAARMVQDSDDMSLTKAAQVLFARAGDESEQ
jgi:chromosome segregation ATPase